MVALGNGLGFSLVVMSALTTYAQRLASAMDAVGMRPQELADHLEITYQAIQKVLKGTSSALTAINTFKAAAALDVDAYWLATGEGVAKAPARPVFSEDIKHAMTEAEPSRKRDAENAARAVLGLDALPRISPANGESRKRA